MLAGVTHLTLSSIELLPFDATLPAVTHLTVQGYVISAGLDEDLDLFYSPLTFPSLTHLVESDADDYHPAWTDPPLRNTPALLLLAPQLTHIESSASEPFLVTDNPVPWQAMTSLKELRLEYTPNEILVTALESLPGSLEVLGVLDIDGPGLGDGASQASFAFANGWASVSGLRMLRLPAMEAVDDPEEGATIGVVAHLVAEAGRRGVRVERVDEGHELLPG